MLVSIAIRGGARCCFPSYQFTSVLKHSQHACAIQRARSEHHSSPQFLQGSAAKRSVACAAVEMTGTPMRDAMHDKLTSQLKPTRLDIVDESSQHAGHAAMKGLSRGETHFRVLIVSQEFEGLATIKRHKMVYQVLAEELAGPVHALSLKTKTPSESVQ